MTSNAASITVNPPPPFALGISGTDDVYAGNNGKCQVQYAAVANSGHSISSVTWSTDGTIVSDDGNGTILVSFSNAVPGTGGHYVSATATDEVGDQAYNSVDITYDMSGDPTECWNYGGPNWNRVPVIKLRSGH